MTVSDWRRDHRTRLQQRLDKPPYRSGSNGYFMVVAVKTDLGIIRAIQTSSWMDTGRGVVMQCLVDSILIQIGKQNLAGTEWTGFTYDLGPSYLRYFGVPSGYELGREAEGVWLWRWLKTDYTDEAEFRQVATWYVKPERLGDLL